MFLTCLTTDGENVIFIAAEYGVCDPLSAVGLVIGFDFCNPSTWTNREDILMRSSKVHGYSDWNRSVNSWRNWHIV